MGNGQAFTIRCFQGGQAPDLQDLKITPGVSVRLGTSYYCAILELSPPGQGNQSEVSSYGLDKQGAHTLEVDLRLPGDRPNQTSTTQIRGLQCKMFVDHFPADNEERAATTLL